MRLIGKVFKKLMMVILVIVVVAAVIGIAFIKISPEFGGTASKSQKESYKKSGHYKDGVFVNLMETSMDMSFANIIDLIGKTIKGTPNKSPNFEIPVQQVDSMDLELNTQTELVWFGHSAFLLQLEGKNILLDPMFGDTPSPSPLLGTKRYSNSLPITIEKLPVIDAIIISHDHYDHLDYGSIKKLKEKTKMFYVPLGVGAHFKEWGVEEERIVEMNWWEETNLENIKIGVYTI